MLCLMLALSTAPWQGQFPVNGTAGGGRRSGIASEKRIYQHLFDLSLQSQRIA